MSDITQYLMLGLEPETYGIDIEHVHEILDLCPIAVLPHAPAFLLGMIDVRGTGYPVIDLRLRLGMKAAPPTPSTRIIILNLTVRGKPVGVGFTADRVFEVTSLDQNAIEPPPDVGGRWDSTSIVGIGRKGPSFVVILDVAHLMGSDSVPQAGIAPPSAAAA